MESSAHNNATVKYHLRNGTFKNSFTESIYNGSLQPFYSLTTMIIRNCEIRYLNSTAFQGLYRLNSLFLVNIGLIHYNADFLHNTPQLYWLRLERNNLKAISPRLFSGSKRLLFLQLRNNNLTNINLKEGDTNGDNMTDLALNSLVFESNPISFVHDYAFSGYGVYGILNLSNCSIETFAKRAFRGLRQLIGIDMSFNLIEYLPDNLFAPVNKTLQLLQATGNKLKHLDIQRHFGGLNELTHFHFNMNELRFINGSFSNYTKLIHVDLAGNCLTKIPPTTFNNVFSLRSLFLQNNSISDLSKTAFSGMRNLEYLNISRNRLDSIPSQPFGDLVSLTHLNLSMNMIKFIENGTFRSCSRLLSVDLSYNKILTLKQNALNGLSSILFLNLSFNNIISISPWIFGQCFGSLNHSTSCILPIEQLHLQNNYLSQFDINIQTPNLTTLNMGRNRITTIGHKMLSTSLSLKFLSLKNNNISVLSFTTGMPYLVTLDVSANQLTQLDQSILAEVKNLKYLYAENNNIKSVDTYDLRQMTSLVTLRLARNSLSCDCSVIDLQQWASAMSSRVEMDYITCLSEGSRKSLQSVSLSYCKNMTLYISVSLAAFLGLLCIGICIVFRFRYEIQVVMYCKWGIRLSNCWKTSDKENFEFDGFVSFVNENDDFVLNNLRPFLEDLHQYRLLIHYRDFHVGEDIATNILHSINKSARIIIVVSVEFLESKWGTFEFERAFYSIISKTTQRLIVIVMTDEVIRIRRDDIVRKILTTKTYVHRNDRLFWKKILFAMPDKNKNLRRSNSEQPLIT